MYKSPHASIPDPDIPGAAVSLPAALAALADIEAQLRAKAPSKAIATVIQAVLMLAAERMAGLARHRGCAPDSHDHRPPPARDLEPVVASGDVVQAAVPAPFAAPAASAHQLPLRTALTSTGAAAHESHAGKPDDAPAAQARSAPSSIGGADASRRIPAPQTGGAVRLAPHQDAGVCPVGSRLMAAAAPLAT